ncbi:MAG: protease inhibitor I42 family protein [Firmicutes bacterium]|nr:protease inhibitor I42 family protein [Bacillota bacterium]
MKIVKKICALVLIGCLFLCGSGFSNKYEDVQIIELKFNPITGYSWNVETIDLGLKYTGKVDVIHTYNCDNENDSICGAGGIGTFFIKGVESGEVGLSFEYKRPWETSQYDREVLALFDVDKSGKVKILAYYDGSDEKQSDSMNITLR